MKILKYAFSSIGSIFTAAYKRVFATVKLFCTDFLGQSSTVRFGIIITIVGIPLLINAYINLFYNESKNTFPEENLKPLIEKLQKQEIDIQEWKKKYEETTKSLSGDAKKALEKGDIKTAEDLLAVSIRKKENPLARDYFDFARIKELKIEYQEALKFYQKAVNLEPENSLYLNYFGTILYTLGQSDKAIEYLEKAYIVMKKRLGNDHRYTRDLKTKLSRLKKR